MSLKLMRPFFLESHSAGERITQIRFFRLSFGLSLLLVICSAALPAWRILPLIYGQTVVPLHYNIHFGVDTIGEWWRIFTVPVLGLLLFVVNVFAARYFFTREKVLSVIAASSTLFLEVVLFVSMVFIVLLNISYG